MAHVEKYKAAQINMMTRHYGRENNHYSNENIDRKKSVFNYNLAPERDDPMGFINRRCRQVRCLDRADVVKMCDWIVTMPKDLPREKEKEFFKETYNFLETKYGRENVVSAYVHLDETTPHMHFAFVPVVKDKKKGDLKVSAKECLTRNDLKMFHDNLQRHLESKLRVPVNILNEATRDGNLAMSDFKKIKASEDYQKAVKTITEAESRAQEIIREAEDQRAAIEAEYQAKKAFLEQEVNFNVIHGVKEIKTITGRTKQYAVPADIWESQKIFYSEKRSVEAMQHQNEQLLKDYKDTKLENKQLREENRLLHEENSRLKKALEKIKAIVKDAPKRIREAVKSIFRQTEDKSPGVEKDALISESERFWRDYIDR